VELLAQAEHLELVELLVAVERVVVEELRELLVVVEHLGQVVVVEQVE
jgi:hypothetical protein